MNDNMKELVKKLQDIRATPKDKADAAKLIIDLVKSLKFLNNTLVDRLNDGEYEELIKANQTYSDIIDLITTESGN